MKKVVLSILCVLIFFGLYGCNPSTSDTESDNSSVDNHSTQLQYTETYIRKGQNLEDYISLDIIFVYNQSKGRYDEAHATVIGISSYQYVNAEVEVYFVGVLYGGTFSINNSGSGQATITCSVNNTSLVMQGLSIKAANSFVIRVPK